MDPLIEKLDTPSLIVDQEVMERNLIEMMDFANESNVALRPHTKTHKCPQLAIKQVELGAVGIAVAKVSEAEVMAQAGIKDIQIANEVVGANKIRRLVPLAKECNLTVAVDNQENARMLSSLINDNGVHVNVLLDVDVGFHRCGISYRSPERIIHLAKMLEKEGGISWKGIMTHAGQVYRSTNKREMNKVGLHEGREMARLANVLRKEGLDCETVSVGSTPTARIAGTVDGVTEIRPGNYIFHDYIQVSLGVAKICDCALRVLASVMSTPTESRVLIDAGSKALGPERGTHGNGSIKGHGFILEKKAEIYTYSEEHGFVGRMRDGTRFELGERIQIVPNHACYVVNLFDRIIGIPDGEVYKIAGRGHSQ